MDTINHLLACLFILVLADRVSLSVGSKTEDIESLTARGKALEEKESSLKQLEITLIEREAALHVLQAALNKQVAAINQMEASVSERSAALLLRVSSLCSNPAVPPSGWSITPQVSGAVPMLANLPSLQVADSGSTPPAGSLLSAPSAPSPPSPPPPPSPPSPRSPPPPISAGRPSPPPPPPMLTRSKSDQTHSGSRSPGIGRSRELDERLAIQRKKVDEVLEPEKLSTPPELADGADMIKILDSMRSQVQSGARNLKAAGFRPERLSL